MSEWGFDAYKIGHSFPCFIMAEIGQNHQGDMDTAKEMIRLAKACGVDCVKFQKSSLPDRFTRKTLESPYDHPNSFGSTYGKHRASLEFSDNQFRQLQYYAESVIGLKFSASAMDIVSADFLMDELNVPFIKIGSGDGNNLLLIEHIAKRKYPIILSTGMQEMKSVRQAVSAILKHYSELVLLHCVSSYPTLPEDVNLRILELYKSEFPDIVVGYSGHEMGINVAMAAATLGAKVIEKHFTLDKNQKGTDHKCSLDPAEMKAMVQGIREIEKSLGIPEKKVLPSEEACRRKLGKSIVASRDLAAGKILEICDLNIKVSRETAINPENIFTLVGRQIYHNVLADEPITPNHLSNVLPNTP